MCIGVNTCTSREHVGLCITVVPRCSLVLCLYPVPVQCFLRALAPTLGISLKEFGLIILCECILSSTRCCRSCLHQSSRMRERGEELLTAEDQPLPNREPRRSAAVPPWFAFSRHIPSHSLTLAPFPQCV